MKHSKISPLAKLGIVDMLNEMKTPITNIKLCVELLESDHEDHERDYHVMIKNNAVKLESRLRELLNTFYHLGISVHLAEDKTPIQ